MDFSETGSAGIILLLGIVLLLAVSFWTWRRTPRRRLLWRMLASALAVFALLALALRPGWKVEVAATSAVLLTPGAEKIPAQQFEDSRKIAEAIFAFPGTHSKAHTNSAPHLISDLGYLQRHYPEVRQLQVFGYGLHDDAWQALDSVALTPHFAPLTTGFKQVYWPRTLKQGQALSIQGEIACADSAKYWLVLADPGGAIDSLVVSPRDAATFHFQTTPREIGRQHYHLSLKTATGKIVVAEMVAVHVQPPRALRLLVLAGSASFETKYLKRWAAQHQSIVVLRTTMSRERYQYEYLNQPAFEWTRLTTDLLRGFDVVLLDGRTLQRLSPKERTALRSAIAQEGLGVLLFPDEVILSETPQNFSDREFFLPFRFEAFRDLNERMIKPRWPHSNGQTLTAIPAEPFACLPTWGSAALITDEQDRMLALAVQRGRGRVGVSLLRETYRWVLEGQAQWHASYWAHLFTELARRESQRDEWHVPMDKPLAVDQPIALTLTTNQALPLGIIHAAQAPPDSFFLSQDEVEASHWRGTYWPRTTGWHKVSTPSGAAEWFYVYAKEDWQTWQQATKIAATSRQALRANGGSRVSASHTFTKVETIPPLWFFALFVLSCVYLWLERKF